MTSVQAICDEIAACVGAASPQAILVWGGQNPRLREELAGRLGFPARLVAAAPGESDAAGLFKDFAREDAIRKVTVVGLNEADGGTELDDALLLAAAQAGFVALDPQADGAGGAEAAAIVSHLSFERRDYRIRLAAESDVAALEDLERRCWPTRLRASRERILTRLRTHPEDHLVLEADDRVAAVVYSQRTDLGADLTGVNMWTAESLHRSDGRQVYLLGIAVRPELQHRNYGGELLDFILQRSARRREVERVVGVTRCKDMARHPQLAPEEYIRLRNELGGLADATLRFHELHGAEIVGLVPDYRPEDHENQRYGVLVRYDLANRRVKTPASHAGPPIMAPLADRSLAQFVRNLAEDLLSKHGDAALLFSLSTPLMQMGLDSGDILELREKINHHCGLSMETDFFFNHNTLQKVLAALQQRIDKAAPPEPGLGAIREDDVAIIGLAVRLPAGINDLESFWSVLSREECVVSRAVEGRLTWPDGVDPERTHRGIDCGGFLLDIAGFDAGLFHISRKEAELMDPQQRLLVELSWECLEQAGYAPQACAGSRTGVYVGASGSDYARLLAETGMETEAHSGLGTSMAIVANRISYLFDLCGPSLLIDTACSSSLVAVHAAVRALRAGECDQALVGGVNIICHSSGSIAYYKAGMLSPDGRCKSFDEAANGYVRAEGGAMILLKPLARALADGDAIHAVIKGSAVNHGGRANGLSVPHPGKQAALVTEAWRDAGVDVARVEYIEAHGSATPLGDPIEMSGLKQALRELSGARINPRRRCAVGSVKSNLGHLEAAAGIVGLIKVVLALKHRMIPASLHFRRLNPHISLEDSPLYVAATSTAWSAPAGEGSRCGGVSSFGSGGTNAHVVLQEAPAHLPVRRNLTRHVFSRQRYWAPDRHTAPRRQAAAVQAATLWRRFWHRLPVTETTPAGEPQDRVIVLSDFKTTTAQSRLELPPGATVATFRSESPQVEERFCDYAERLLETVREPMRSVQGKRILVQLLAPGEEEGMLLTGLAAAFRTLHEENPRVNGQVVVADGSETMDRLLAKAELASRFPAEAVVRFRDEGLLGARWGAVEESGSGEMPWRPDGVYLIVGGAGGIGRCFAAEIMARVPTARVVVAGRTSERPPLPDRAEYRRADFAQAAEVETLVSGITAQFGRLDGVLHAAGVLRDGLAVKKSSEEMRAVMAPKVKGTVHLARALADLETKPDFLVLFGSTSGALGNAGQFDYAAANAFQDVYAGICAAAAKRVLAIDWPLWRDGGMRVDIATETALRETWGARPLETAPAFQAFYRALQTRESQILVWNGAPERIAEWPAERIVAQVAEPASIVAACESLEQRLKGVLAEVAGAQAADIDEARPFQNYGFDSILMTDLSRKLGTVFPEMSRTLLYEYDTVAALARFLETQYPSQCARWTGASVTPSARVAVVEPSPHEGDGEDDDGGVSNPIEPIAIVGMSVRFPGAETLPAFWRMLEKGEVAVAAGPLGRWPQADSDAAGEKKHTAWGGFLREPYLFDPLFFGMTPREAEETDPQERLFLEECWKALEDAGYSAADLPPAVRRKAAVFAAITKQGYNLTGGPERWPVTSFASMANRISYHFDLQGPSLPIDTMCSSALVAVHHACQYLRQGGEMAIVGGANLYLHPSTLSRLEADQLLSGTECSDPFGCKGNGFIPGEGVGALVLKPLRKAERDGDAVYALIRGSAVNHGGKGANYTAPSARQQAKAIQDALKDSGVGLETIGYLETAANGSQLGDSAEAAAIAKVFGERTASAANRYWMGSVKPNIGHPEAASGLAQIAKVSLALRHGKLPPTVLSAEFEACVPLQCLPFELIRECEPWVPLTVAGQPCARRAGISGVGAGGVNAHIILEEYIPKPPNAITRPVTPDQPVVLPISARTPEALQAYTHAWLDYLADHPHAELSQLAYVAQVGRPAMACRRAIVATGLEDLKSQLRDAASASSTVPTSRAVSPETIEPALARRDWSSLAQFWEAGADVPWVSLYDKQNMRRLHGLPVYPFARRDCSPASSSAPAAVAKSPETPGEGASANRAVEFYSEWARASASEMREDFLTFCPFETRVPGFSMSRAFLFPEKFRDDWALMKAKQIELRQVLFYEEDFAALNSVFDIGCGFGNDLTGLARACPQLRAEGFSLTAEQCRIADTRIARAGLQDRVRVWQRDSAKSAFPNRYDLVLGIEVTFHIREKDRLLENIVGALRAGGRVLLMDFVTNLRGAIVDPNLEISIPTKREWVELLSRHGLALTSVIDVSQQIANFLYDPDFHENTRDLHPLIQQTIRNYANQSQSLEHGWVSYCLLKIQKAEGVHFTELSRRNRDALNNPIPYPAALAAMRAFGPIPYPRTDAGMAAILPDTSPAPNLAVGGVQDELLALCAKELGFARTELSPQSMFSGLGVGSVEATRLTQAVNERFDLELSTSVILDCRTVGDFAVAIAARRPQDQRPLRSLPPTGEDTAGREPSPDAVFVPDPAPAHDEGREAIAVIGLSLRCAGADGPEAFWDLIREGRDAVSTIEDPAWLEVLRSALPAQEVFRRGAIRDAGGFDAGFFNLSPREAAAMDVSQRLILEQSYKALEDAGYSPDHVREVKAGTFVGAGGSSATREDHSHFALMGTDSSVLASRIAYYLDLKGPAMAVNAACASSLAAIDLAIGKLRGREIDLAIAGGVAVFDDPVTLIQLHKAGLLSPTGMCRPFDAAANGFVPGDGVGVVILKRLVDAERDGDSIYGVIRGIAGNHNGQTLGLTVPSASAQHNLLSTLYARCGVAAADIQYVETNGTATRLGDSVELSALARVYGDRSARQPRCGLGALKGNIGNCGAASGVLALIKMLLSLKHRTLPPVAGFSLPTPEFDFARSPFHIESTAGAWPANGRRPRLAALSAFGFNGSNYHMVLEESPPVEARPHFAPRANLLLLSAHSHAQLRDLADAVNVYLKSHADVPLEDIVFTLRTGRRFHAVRLAVVTDDRDRLSRDLENVARGNAVNDDRVHLTRTDASTLCLDDTREGANFLAQLAASGRMDKLARLWVDGVGIDWSRLGIDRGARRVAGLPTYPFSRAAAETPFPPTVDLVPADAAASLVQALRTTLAECLSLTDDRVPVDAPFHSLGLDSIVAAEWAAELNRRHGWIVSLQSLQMYPTVRQLAHWLQGQDRKLAETPAAAHSAPASDPAAPRLAMPADSTANPFVVRPASLVDLETWAGLEKALLPEDMATPMATLRERIANNPAGNFLVERNGRSVGYLSLLRVKCVEHLRQATFDELASTPSDESGEVLLLSDLGLPPDRSDAGLSAETLAWVLKRAASTTGVKSVVHIARCTGFWGQSESDFANYLVDAHRKGFTTEPLLRDHRQLGGAVRGLVANYRRADRANLGAGVWMEHDLNGKTEPPPLGDARRGKPADPPSLSRLMKDHPQIVPLAMQGSGPTTFWMHPMSGEVGVYHKLAGQLRGEFKMIGLQARGFLRPEHKPLDSMAAIAWQFADIVTAVEPSGPYHLAGFSFGGTIAHEVARELQARDAQIASLLMIEAPFVTDEVAELTTMSRRTALVVNANLLLLALLAIDSNAAAELRSAAADLTGYRLTEDMVCNVPDKDLPDFLAAHCKSHGVNRPVEILKQKLATMTDVHLANIRAVQAYRTTALKRPEEIRCALLRTRDAIATSRFELDPPYLDAIQRRYRSMEAVLEGWNSVLPNAESVVLEGANHFELFHDERSVSAVFHAVRDFYQSRSFPTRGGHLPPANIERIAPAAPTGPEAGGEGGVAIAVIGMSGRFPEANDVEAFWQNLAGGRNSVKTAPANRGWNIDDYYDPRPQQPAKTYCRRGAFLEDIDCFDPLFFGISPIEAELMDPSERLFLQEAWRAIEHAGYAPDRLKRRKWGVFACVKGDYPILVRKYHPTFLAATDSLPPARLSYTLDLCGPAISIDTACSSALAAVAYACDSLSAGSCETAVVGAGGMFVTPNMLVTSSQSLLFSPDGECYTFDERANGTVLGEAVGVVVLKRMDDALKDGDPVLGVIRGWGTNQNGRTNGLTAPSGLSQAALQTSVYRRYGIDPDKISLVEAHGTGTRLGDPVEYQALRQSFAPYTRREHYCALGSLKTNIGHSFAAAGIAGLIKVLLALQHRQIPPSLNFQKLNPAIDERGSPFFVNTVLRDWEGSKGQPRLAAINSFGATGINVHLVVEEHRDQIERGVSTTRESPVAIVLSAKDRPQLQAKCRELLEWIRRRRAGSPLMAPNLRDLAYTLQVARDPMEARLAFVANSLDELESRLLPASEDTAGLNGSYYGEGKPGRASGGGGAAAAPDAVAGKSTQAALESLAHDWAHGTAMDWDAVYRDVKPRRIHLPGYVFARERYWIGSESHPAEPTLNAAAQEHLHPLLHRNTSRPGKLRYSSFFTGNEFFLADHVVNGERILPGVAYLEMAREAAVRAIPAMKGRDPQSILCLRNIVWLRPFAVGSQGRGIHVELEARGDGEIAFEIFSEEAGDSAQRVVHSQGRLELRTHVNAIAPETFQLLQAPVTLSAESCYRAFRDNRVDYGPGHRGLVRIYLGGAGATKSEVLARLELPGTVREGSERFVLHPGLLDSALQAAVGFAYVGAEEEGRRQLSMPFALDDLEIHSPCAPQMWAHLRRVQTMDAGESIRKLDIDLYDAAGRGLMRLRGFSSRVIASSIAAPGLDARPATLMFVPVWRPVTSPGVDSSPRSRWVIEVNSAGQETVPDSSADAGVEVSHIHLRDGSAAEQYTHLAMELFERIRARLKENTGARLLLQIALAGPHRSLLAAVSALVRTAEQEFPRISGQVVELSGDRLPSNIFERLSRLSASAEQKQVRDEDAGCRALRWEPLPSSEAAPAWRDGGVYLITGGAGGLGWIFAREIARRARNPVLILIGRSPVESLDQARLMELRSLGANVSYEQVDVTQRSEVDRLIRQIMAQHGALHGVLHAAGVVRDRLILNKTADEFASVLASKVCGVACLDEATCRIPLEQFVLFSSGAAVLGNPGQADYAAANAFMDRFAEMRHQQVMIGERHGRTLSVNWPLWEEGGMKVSPDAVSAMARSLGIAPLPTRDGLQAFYDACASTASQVMVIHGDPSRIAMAVAVPQSESPVEEAAPTAPANQPAGGADPLQDRVIAHFRSLIAAFLKIPLHRVDPTETFEKYGIDSIVATALINEMEETFGSLPRTLLFEYQNIEALSAYFLNKQRERMARLIGVARETASPAPTPALALNAPPRLTTVSTPAASSTLPVAHSSSSTDVAIIGMAGRFPGARTILEFWDNLRAGKDCVTEIPPDRWDMASHFTPDKSQPGKSYSKWGGFIDEVDLFDPLFFNLAPQIASLIDPKERLFLETVWELFESVGLTRSTLQRRHAGAVGVFVGAMYQDYHAFDSTWINEAMVSLSSYSSIANRVSHFFDFRGPSVAVDTMCSSTLSAIKMACDSLERGECEMAVAGGANLSLHPKKYVGLSLGQMIGSHPDSRAFAQGDGYIPAETVGAFLLKPLSGAVHDGDRVMAVIKAALINHDGGSNGFGIPNPASQTKLIQDNFRRSGIHPRTVTYVEAAANGSALGDPIEVAALNTAFRAFTEATHYCAIGAVKSNIGHAEAASGVGQLAKVVLQLQHGEVVPSIKAERLNPNLSFDGSPFYLQRESAAWPRQPGAEPGDELPRRACVSSFGAGGSNAHLIVEEYVPTDARDLTACDDDAPQVLAFSARTTERLRVHVERILAALRRTAGISLRGLAYTLQCGREAMNCRLAFVAPDLDVVRAALHGWLHNEAAPAATQPRIYSGDRLSDSQWNGLASGRPGAAWIEGLLAERDLEKLALLWANGASVPWHDLYSSQCPKIVALPTYPFERRRCRLEPAASALDNRSRDEAPAAVDLAAPNWRSLLAGMLSMREDELNLDTPLQEYGLESVLRTQFMQFVQTHVEANPSLDDLRSCRTLRELLAVLPEAPVARAERPGLQAATAQGTFRELVRLGKGSEPPVFWFHAAVGGVEAYEFIAAHSRRTFYGIQARGWMSDEPPLRGVAALADYYAHIVQTVQPTGPYDLGGYSMGGALAYEVTRRLQQAGRSVESIVMLDTLDGAGAGPARPSLFALYLQAINTLLASSSSAASNDVTRCLIRRDEVIDETSESAFLDRLVNLARERGLAKTAAQLRSIIVQIAAVQRAYEYENFTITPLPRPNEVEVCYVRNAGGVFLGQLDPYFNLDGVVNDRSDHWQEWEAHLPNFRRIDVSSTSHMTLLKGQEPLSAILELCGALYGTKSIQTSPHPDLVAH